VTGTVLIEKCQSLFPTQRAAMFVGQSRQMRNCDFGHHSVSILFFGRGFYRPVPRASKPFIAAITRISPSDRRQLSAVMQNMADCSDLREIGYKAGAG